MQRFYSINYFSELFHTYFKSFKNILHSKLPPILAFLFYQETWRKSRKMIGQC